MKRRVLILAACVVAGAIVNVGVAWGCVLALAGGGTRTHGWGVVEQDTPAGGQAWEYALFDPGPVSMVWWLPRSSLPEVESVPAPPWSAPPQVDPYELEGAWDFVEFAAGWPCLSMKARGRGPVAMFGFTGEPVATGGLRVGDVARPFVPHILPMQPLAVGFAVNTAVFATVLGLLGTGAMAWRSRRRRRRGLCAKCAFPTGERGRCPECGAGVPGSLAEAS